jgi:NAD(P)-dependent dehydrogenase (short-subunit alcohol dehydrogenase family)
MVILNMGSTPRVALVTGGTNGIGRAVALRLARGGDRVLFVGRDPERGAQLLTELRALRPGAQHVYLQADLSLLADTARLADAVAEHTQRLDAVVCCAGVLSTVPEWTSEGLERSFVLNYLSRYLLVTRLLPNLLLAPSGRVVLVANAGKYTDTLDFSDLQLRRGKRGLHVSGRTQFANDLLATELAARLRDTRMEVTCVAPGLVRTDVFRNARGLPGFARGLATVLQPLIAMKPERAADTPAYLARDAMAVGISGAFFGPDRRQIAVPEAALRRDRRSLLWEVSQALVRDYLPEASDDATRPRIFVVKRPTATADA